ARMRGEMLDAILAGPTQALMRAGKARMRAGMYGWYPAQVLMRADLKGDFMTQRRPLCGGGYVLLRNYHEWIYPIVRVFHLIFYTILNVMTGFLRKLTFSAVTFAAGVSNHPADRGAQRGAHVLDRGFLNSRHGLSLRRAAEARAEINFHPGEVKVVEVGVRAAPLEGAAGCATTSTLRGAAANVQALLPRRVTRSCARNSPTLLFSKVTVLEMRFHGSIAIHRHSGYARSTRRQRPLVSLAAGDSEVGNAEPAPEKLGGTFSVDRRALADPENAPMRRQIAAAAGEARQAFQRAVFCVRRGLVARSPPAGGVARSALTSPRRWIGQAIDFGRRSAEFSWWAARWRAAIFAVQLDARSLLARDRAEFLGSMALKAAAAMQRDDLKLGPGAARSLGAAKTIQNTSAYELDGSLATSPVGELVSRDQLRCKGDPSVRDDSRGLLLADRAAKGLASIAKEDMGDLYIRHVPLHQCGAVAGGAADFATHIVRGLLAIAEGLGCGVFALTVDLVKAFDKIVRELVVGWGSRPIGERAPCLVALGFGPSAAEWVVDFVEMNGARQRAGHPLEDQWATGMQGRRAWVPEIRHFLMVVDARCRLGATPSATGESFADARWRAQMTVTACAPIGFKVFGSSLIPDRRKLSFLKSLVLSRATVASDLPCNGLAAKSASDLNVPSIDCLLMVMVGFPPEIRLLARCSDPLRPRCWARAPARVAPLTAGRQTKVDASSESTGAPDSAPDLTYAADLCGPEHGRLQQTGSRCYFI
ncbi:unnamed protein product, partial [Prorocentrum cordatum]